MSNTTQISLSMGDCRESAVQKTDVPAVKIKDVTFTFNKDPALKNVTLNIPQGDFMALIGPNGGGKTTLIRLIMGLITPQSGNISVFGNPPEFMQAHIGYVPQFSTMRLDFPASVLDVVLMGAAQNSLLGGFWSRGKKARKTALEHLETLGLSEEANAPINTLSGGQRQRALVARALMGRPEAGNSPFLLLLDEPTASVDPKGTFCFYEFLDKLRGDVSIIVVSHDLFVASPFFDHIAFVNKQVTTLPDCSSLSGEDLVALFGSHTHQCPVADLQHAVGLHHDCGCTHEHCAHPDKTLE